MARFTSIGMPRKTFVSSTAEEARQPSPSAEAGPSTLAAEDDKPKKKVHRSGKKQKAKRERAAAAAASAEQEGGGDVTVATESEGPVAQRGADRQAEEEQSGGGQKRKAATGWGRDEGLAKKTRIAEQRAEERRVQRIEEKKAALTCFGCRQSGHTARDCPKKGGVTGNICYRCNSTNHSLSNCPRPADPADPTPFATCFVCNQPGHLSSQCEQNAKGVYVHGGKCNVCGSVRHLIRDCPDLKARREEAAARDRNAADDELARGLTGGGADEDDFMMQSRVRMREMAAKEAARGVKGKREKKAFNNNGLREPYKKAAEGEDGPLGLEEASSGAPQAALSEASAAKPKAKAKIVAF